MVWAQVASAVAPALIDKVFGGGTSAAKQSSLQTEVFAHNLEAQKRYESDAIQRRVADAKLAGVSPMAALGMTPSGGGAAVGGNFDYQAMGDDNSLGQNVGRAISAAADPMVRLNQRLLASQIDGQELDNDYKRSQLARQTGQIGPSMPGIIDNGTGPEYKNYRLQDGRAFTAPHGELLDLMENSPMHGAAVVVREVLHKLGRIGKSFSDWRYNSRTQKARRVFGRYPGSDYR